MDYKKIYDVIMGENMQNKIMHWKPGRGWPSTYHFFHAEPYCQKIIGPNINAMYDSFTSDSKWELSQEKEFKTTTDLSFCEYDADLGIFMGCQDQRYHR